MIENLDGVVGLRREVVVDILLNLCSRAVVFANFIEFARLAAACVLEGDVDRIASLRGATPRSPDLGVF